MAAENTVQRMVWVAVAATTILFRVNTGKAWLSNQGPGGVRRLEDGSVHILAARPIALGFANPKGDPVVGTADLIGWTSITITPEMVGARVAVYTAIETKRTTGGRTSDAQAGFIAQVLKAGGIAGVANTPAVAQAIVRDYRPPRPG